MKTFPIAIIVSLLFAVPASVWSTPTPLSVPASAHAPEEQVDTLFSKWNKPGIPGAVIEVVQHGKVVLRKSYGMADLEQGVRMSPDTVLAVGSVSKQFTAFAIHLLAQEGKLGLDDDVHKYLPAFPDFGKTITLRHMLQHTSGLRDPMNLMVLGGWRLDDIVTEDDTLTVIGRQRTLNFAPGEEYLYSNAGYNVLAQIVKRVAGKSLAQFASERIFKPLGMTHTAFKQDYRTVVPGRALSYAIAPEGGYLNVPENHDGAGPGGLLTTVDDLMLWDRNFYDGKVGGKALIASMHALTPLNNGKPNRYASGLFIESYRGRKLIEHSGGIAGYRAVLARYPEQDLSVAVLANTADINAVSLGRKVADIYLGGAPSPSPDATVTAPAPKEVVIDPAYFQALRGYYALTPQVGIDITVDDGALMLRVSGQQKVRLYPSAKREFFMKVVNASISFNAPDNDGVVAGIVLHQDGQDLPATRGAVPVPSKVEDYVGEFHSDELHVLYNVFLEDGRLMLTYPRGTVPLDYAGDGAFLAPLSSAATVTYQCTPGGCSGFTVSNGRVRNLQFTKVAIVRADTLTKR